MIADVVHQHVYLNHLPVAGAAFGALALMVGLILRTREALLPGLLVLVIAGLTAWPVQETGKRAYKPVYALADDDGLEWLEVHRDRATGSVWFFYLLAGLAAAALLVPLRWPRLSVPLTIAAALAALVAVGRGAYIAEAGGRIRHVEFRPLGGPPGAAPEQP